MASTKTDNQVSNLDSEVCANLLIYIISIKSVFAYAIGEWDLRQAVVQGRLKGVIRWMFKRRDEIHAKVRELQRQGQINGTQWNLVVNLDKFNSKQHLCAQCLRLYTDWVTTLEAHYPSSQDKIFVINCE